MTVESSASPATDAFTAEILRSYLVSTVREMVITTTRTAYSTCFCHGEDFTCGIFDADGRMTAQDQGVGVHAGGLEGAVQSVMRAAGQFEPGDVYLHNDPYDGGTHQGDVCVVRPMFVADQLVGFAANRGHWSDVGGMAPGGWSGTAQDVVQEGLLLPSVRLFRAGEIQRDIQELVMRNVRLPQQCWGDLQAQIASSIAAERRIKALVDRNGLEGLAAATDAAISYTRRRYLNAVEALEEGKVCCGEDIMEDDGRGNGPFPIRVRVWKEPDGRFVADFEGTSPQVNAPINCTLACTKAAVIGSLVAMTDPELPLNAGLTEMVDVRAPLGCMVNPTYPAPTFGTTADPVARTMETVMRAFGELLPERAVAGSYSTGQNATGGGVTEDGEFLWYSYQAGGCGAWQGGDGNTAMWHLMANSKNESCEAWEARYPIRYIEYRIVDDSGGPGQWRGGLGTERRFQVQAPTRLSAIAGHHGIGAHGLNGGEPGMPNGFWIERDGERRSVQDWYDLASPSKFANLELRPGDVFVTTQGGGGGYGDARDRDPEAVAADVRASYVSRENAARRYGR